MVSSSNFRFIGVSAAAIAATMLVMPAYAQSEAAGAAPVASLPSSAEQANEASEIVVTGSRLQNTGFSAPTPVTVVGAADIARQGATSVSEVLNQVPAFRAQNTPTTAANITANLGASTADLRGLGANRTLVLINNRRVVGSTVRSSGTVPANTVDLGMIPTALIERSEVVTGGASAQYGSDAVAGVVNIILNTKLEGFRGSLQYGQTDYNDARDYTASMAWGTRLGDRGHLVVGGDYNRNSGTGDCYTRSWCAESFNQVTAPPANRGNGFAAVNILPNTATASASYNGLINAGPLRGVEFSPDGRSTFQHNYGTYFFNGGLFQAGGGDGENAYYRNFALGVSLRRYSTFAHANYDLTDNVNAFAEVSYADTRGSNPATQNRDTNLVIQRDNAFLPASLVAAMTSANLTSVTIGRIGQDFGPAIGHVQRNTFRGVVGLDGKLGNGWSWNTYYQYGRTNYHQQVSNNKINANYTRAIDAVMGPNGTIACRVNVDNNPNNNDPACSPLNIFGENNWSQQAKNYAFGNASQDTKISQHVVAASLAGSLFEMPAGPVSFAIGGEYREDHAIGSADPISNALGFYTNPGAGIDGSLNVKEGFLELGVPLIKDASFTHSLDLNGAIRVTDYSTSGSVTTWKLGATWEPVRQLRLRVTRSRDIRAPNVFELYGPQSSSFQSVNDPQRGNNVLPSVILGGNANLTPEVAKTFTVGAVLQPDFWGLNRLRFSVDYYDIKLDNAIATLGAQLIVTLCAQGQTALCNQVTREPNGDVGRVLNTDLNLNRLQSRGIDFELAYSTPLSDIFDSAAGNLSARVLATRVSKLATTDRTGTTINRANQIGSPVSATSGVPRWQGNAFLTYSNGPFSGTLQVRYISGGKRDVTLIGPEDSRYQSLLSSTSCPAPLQANCTTNINRAPAYTYMNVNLSYAIVDDGARKVEVFGVVNNLFNKNPPNYLQTSFGATNNALYDVLGRTYRAGVRVAF